MDSSLGQKKLTIPFSKPVLISREEKVNSWESFEFLNE